MRICQEFYCTTSGGGCGGYTLLRLSECLHGPVVVVCPNCKHRHPRTVKGGRIVEEGRLKDGEEIISPKSAYSKTPRAEDFLKGLPVNERDAAVVPAEEKPSLAAQQAHAILRESWAERFAGKLMGK